jgi:hypothetical protein
VEKLLCDFGDRADVRYVKSDEDTTRKIQDGYHVLDDASVVPSQRLLHSYI